MHWLAIGIAAMVFLLLPKRMGVPVAVAALLYAGWSYRTETGGGVPAAQLSSVRMTAEYNAKACGSKTPLRITIENGSGQPVRRVSWNVGASVPGTSSNVVSYMDIGAGYYQTPFTKPYSHDRLLLVGHRSAVCLALPPMAEGQEPAELNWFVTDKDVEFRRD